MLGFGESMRKIIIDPVIGDDSIDQIAILFFREIPVLIQILAHENRLAVQVQIYSQAIDQLLGETNRQNNSGPNRASADRSDESGNKSFSD